ncbi:MAG: UTRA domain-containing protein [Granulosicoccus sp.]|nr:UTRA domain-containing protein [Granulosicoccus sp.]
MVINGWQDVQDEVLRRLQARIWKPGELLPNEADLAAEFGCARTTVNRALQVIADEGLLERRRRGGTRVLVHPTRRATFNISLIRREIEQQGYAYGYRLLSQRHERPPAALRERMQLQPGIRIPHLKALHSADGEAFVLEDRWINVSVVPEAAHIDFRQQSANQWLVENIPFCGGNLALSATHATNVEADLLAVDTGTALFTAERHTRNSAQVTITNVRLLYAPGYQMQLEL